ncbi:MAG: polyphosphate kinase 1 [Chroococcidiopsidaceae cyanobacterium CP_BM_ER_R8_30]|nr:polyphosphate kinase 1 [Chroococcidiopsidaceae cyanobacterium CP_BM_ER_R8_30]
MSKVKATTSELNLSDPKYYLNRELSWLEFNRRVLHEALDPRTPLLERLKFVAIFCSNLDEFFMVRVSGLKEQVEAQLRELTPDGRTPEQQLDEITQHLRPMVTQQHQLFEQELRPQLATIGVHVLNYTDINQEQRLYLQGYFEARIFPVLTPLAVDPAHPFPYISNLSLNLAVVVKEPETGEENFARVKVPNSLPRFVPFPQELQQQNEQLSIWAGVPLEQVIAHNLGSLFPGMNVQECSFFRVTRDADFGLELDEGDDLILAIQQELRQRRVGGAVVRLELQASTPTSVRETLMSKMQLTETDVYEIEGLLGLKDLMSFMALPLPEFKDPPWTPVIPRRLRWFNEVADTRSTLDTEEAKDIFSVIRQRDLLLHHPYESFTASVELFITQAALDPQVLAIKMTLYRTSGDSPIVKALIAAAENGKQVAVLVELRARFDEESNVGWARQLESSGVHVVYGLMGLKTHTKVVLVVRQEGDHIRRYVHIGTGNYNSKTAKLYTDLGLLSCQDDLGADLTDLFNYLTGLSKQKSYRKLLVAPVTLREGMVELIQREIENCQNGGSGRIVTKINALIDTQIIRMLYKASQAGVQIDLIVRGMCCLRPGIKGVSENIRVISIIGRYLEHSRIFHFHNNGQEKIFIGSADWRSRNLDRRVEAVTPIEDPDVAKELKELLDIFLADNRQAWELQSDGSYIQRRPTDHHPEQSAQNILMERARAEIARDSFSLI